MRYLNAVSSDLLMDMHFVVKKDDLKELWLVIDALNSNAIVGVHELETLAFLDASKREQDTHLLNLAIH